MNLAIKQHLSFLVLLTFVLVARAEEPFSPPTTTDNCDVIGVDFKDNPEMTRAEKLAVMEKAFYESLNKFEDCNSPPTTSQSSSSSSLDSTSASIASDSLQGTEPNIIEETVSVSSGNANETTTGTAATGVLAPSTNGKIPEDIPPAENDDAIAAQIRLAAEAETDPGTREKLWNEYRKYKEMNVEQ